MWIRLAATNVLVAVLALVGAPAFAGATSDRAGARSTDSLAASLAVTTRAGLCPPLHPIRLTVYAETPDELPYLSQIDACTNARANQVWLRNGTDLVWTPSLLVPGRTAGVYGLSASAKAFATQAGRPGLGVMVPDSTVVIDAPPSWVNWRFSIGLSAAWDARSYLIDWSIATGLAQASLSTRWRTAGAIGTCVLAVKNAVDAAQSEIANNWVSASTVVSKTLNTAVVTTQCGKGLRTLAIERNVRLPHFLDDLTRFEYTLLKRADRVMANLQKAQNLWKYLALIR